MKILAKEDTEFGEITVIRNRSTGSHVYVQGGYAQSEADRNGVSLTSYIHAIYGLLAQTVARRVLMIGCGGGTLATMLAKARHSVTLVDINPMSITLAQRYFALPPEISCHVGDGKAFLRTGDDTYDAIVVDAFIGGEAQDHLCSQRFFELARQRLTAAGCIFVNVMVDHDFDDRADIVASRMAEAGFRVRLLDMPGRQFRNAIAIGGGMAALKPPALLVRPDGPCEELELELGRMRLRTWRPDGPWPPIAA